MRELPNWLWAALVLALIGVVVWGAFLAYQFNDQIVDTSCMVAGQPCGNRIAVRHVLTIGLDWHFRPIRID